MENPFEKRAHEHLRDLEAFLSIVSPEPVSHYLAKYGREERLYDRLVVLLGSPGSGKTTIAKLFEFEALVTLGSRADSPAYRELARVMTQCGALQKTRPAIIGCRLPMESEYRDCWEFEYPERLRFGLMTGLIQARAVLAWARGLRAAGHDLLDVLVQPQPAAEDSLDTIGGATVAAIREKAVVVERAIYKIVNALVPPNVEDLDEDAVCAYSPFDLIRSFAIPGIGELQPLVMLDDAHVLRGGQYERLKRWLIRRELRVGRWMLTRLDALDTLAILESVEQTDRVVDLPGITAARDMITVPLQATPTLGRITERWRRRTDFQKMARDMSGRYLSRMPLLRQEGVDSFASILDESQPRLTPGKVSKIGERLASDVRRNAVPEEVLSALRDSVVRFFKSARRGYPEEILLASQLILLHRWVKRGAQRELFAEQPNQQESFPRMKPEVLRAAEIQLLHSDNRPYFYGFNTLANASSDNVEQFLRLSAALVEQAATRIVRGRSARLTPLQQDLLLREKARQVMGDWNFPRHREVRRLLDGVAKRLVDRTLENNAPLDAGANAFGVPQEEVDEEISKFRMLAEVLRYGYAYNAFALVRNYSCKNRLWLLIEFGGIPCLHYGLTLRRGGFVEGSLDELVSVIGE